MTEWKQGDLVYLKDKDYDIWRRGEVVEKIENKLYIHLFGWGSSWDKEINLDLELDRLSNNEYTIVAKGGVIATDGRSEHLEFISYKKRVEDEKIKTELNINLLENKISELVYQYEKQKLDNYQLKLENQRKQVELCNMCEKTKMSHYLAQMIYEKKQECPICLQSIKFVNWRLNACGHVMCVKCAEQVNSCGICRKRKNLYLISLT